MKFIIFIAMLAASLSFAAQDTTLSQREVRDPRKLEAIIESNATDVSNRIPQTDTNATTTATAYTPTAIGQLLIGSAGSGTDAVWVAKGLTTNSWVQVEP